MEVRWTKTKQRASLQIRTEWPYIVWWVRSSGESSTYPSDLQRKETRAWRRSTLDQKHPSSRNGSSSTRPTAHCGFLALPCLWLPPCACACACPPANHKRLSVNPKLPSDPHEYHQLHPRPPITPLHHISSRCPPTRELLTALVIITDWIEWTAWEGAAEDGRWKDGQKEVAACLMNAVRDASQAASCERSSIYLASRACRAASLSRAAQLRAAATRGAASQQAKDMPSVMLVSTICWIVNLEATERRSVKRIRLTVGDGRSRGRWHS